MHHHSSCCVPRATAAAPCAAQHSWRISRLASTLTPAFGPVCAIWQYPRQAGSPRGIVLSLLKLKRNRSEGVASLVERCGARCLQESTCRFFSLSHAWRTCILCTACALGTEGRLTKSYSSWSVVDPARFQPLSAEPVNSIVSHLQGEYSMRLYGRAGVVPMDLRVVWLGLLDEETQSVRALIEHSGICSFSAAPPHQPFYAPQDLGGANPLDLVWLHRSAPRAAPSHSWLEVTHCAQIMPAPLDSEALQRVCNRSIRHHGSAPSRQTRAR
jgi:hypothetical protein